MDDPVLTAADVRLAWRDATRAAELAARLADLARDAADHVDRDLLDAHELAALAEATAEAANHAAASARMTALEAADPSSGTPSDVPSVRDNVRWMPGGHAPPPR